MRLTSATGLCRRRRSTAHSSRRTTNLRRERLTMDDLLAEARTQQISSLDDVRFAVLETSGKISFLTK